MEALLPRRKQRTGVGVVLLPSAAIHAAFQLNHSGLRVGGPGAVALALLEVLETRFFSPPAEFPLGPPLGAPAWDLRALGEGPAPSFEDQHFHKAGTVPDILVAPKLSLHSPARHSWELPCLLPLSFFPKCPLPVYLLTFSQEQP